MSEMEGSNPPRIKPKKKETLWLYSLTDLTFILMAFFALMLSMSKPDRKQFDTVVSHVQDQNPGGAKPANLTSVASELQKTIEQQKLTGDLRVAVDADGLYLEFSEKLLFGSGSAKVNPDFNHTAEKVLKVLAKAPDRYQISIEGHTDEVPIKTKSGFKSNWELSAARGIAVLNILKVRGIDPKRMRVLALADTQPKVPIEEKKGAELEDARRSNRRVLIRLE